jgi:hypothetical protein
MEILQHMTGFLDFSSFEAFRNYHKGTLGGARVEHNEMNSLLTARSLMGLTLAFHIIYAAVDACLPPEMTVTGWRWRSTTDPAYLLLAKR